MAASQVGGMVEWCGCGVGRMLFLSQVLFGRISVGFLWGFGVLQSWGVGGLKGKLMEKTENTSCKSVRMQTNGNLRSKLRIFGEKCITFSKKLLVWQPAILLFFQTRTLLVNSVKILKKDPHDVPTTVLWAHHHSGTWCWPICPVQKESHVPGTSLKPLLLDLGQTLQWFSRRWRAIDSWLMIAGRMHVLGCIVRVAIEFLWLIFSLFCCYFG